ncbi:6760_t:CDS:2, partial [Ambispora leptoticha]
VIAHFGNVIKLRDWRISNNIDEDIVENFCPPNINNFLGKRLSTRIVLGIGAHYQELKILLSCPTLLFGELVSDNMTPLAYVGIVDDDELITIRSNESVS